MNEKIDLNSEAYEKDEEAGKFDGLTATQWVWYFKGVLVQVVFESEEEARKASKGKGGLIVRPNAPELDYNPLPPILQL